MALLRAALAAAALFLSGHGVAAAGCADSGDVFQCHYNIECIWCQDKASGSGHCAHFTHTPGQTEKCDSLEGCQGHRQEALCNKDAQCKWCSEWTQGWPYCANVTEDVHTHATCSKATPSVVTAVVAAEVVDDSGCASNPNPSLCHYNIECIWCQDKASGSGHCAHFTHTPGQTEKCDSLEGCQGHREEALCNKDAQCKWCSEFTQGWPYCANVTEDVHSHAACSKTAPTAAVAVAAPPVVADVSGCASNSNPFLCHYNIECIWCQDTASGEGHCADFTHTPGQTEKCDSVEGCQGHRQEALCNKDAQCKWCSEFTQGWPFCANVTDDVHSHATCSKAVPPAAAPAPEAAVAPVSSMVADGACPGLADPFACHYHVECIWCQDKANGKGHCAAYTYAPLENEQCDSLAGCQGHRESAPCNADAACKWCTTFTQGWPFCADAGADMSGSANCSKGARVLIV